VNLAQQPKGEPIFTITGPLGRHYVYDKGLNPKAAIERAIHNGQEFAIEYT